MISEGSCDSEDWSNDSKNRGNALTSLSRRNNPPLSLTEWQKICCVTGFNRGKYD